MANFRYWRKMTWALLVWGAVTLVFIIGGGFELSAIVIAALGLIVLGFIWYMTRPLWRVGHGARVRRMRSLDIPFKRPRSATRSSEQSGYGNAAAVGRRSSVPPLRQPLGTRYCVFGPESEVFVASCSRIIALARLLGRPRLTPMPTPLWKP